MDVILAWPGVLQTKLHTCVHTGRQGAAVKHRSMYVYKLCIPANHKSLF